MENHQVKVAKFTGEEFLEIGEVARLFWENGVSEKPPKLVIVMGGVGAGKTTIRRQQFSKGFVNFDIGDIYTAFKEAFGKEYARLPQYVMVATDMVFKESIEAKKNIVIEIIGDSYEAITPVIDKMKESGYDVSIQGITCDIAEAYERHHKAVKEDENYISAYFTQESTLRVFYNYFDLGEVPEAVKAVEDK